MARKRQPQPQNAAFRTVWRVATTQLGRTVVHGVSIPIPRSVSQASVSCLVVEHVSTGAVADFLASPGEGGQGERVAAFGSGAGEAFGLVLVPGLLSQFS